MSDVAEEGDLQIDENLPEAHLQRMAQKIVSHGVKMVRKIASGLNKNVYFHDLEKKRPKVSLVKKTYLILSDWMEDNSLDVSAEERLEHYVKMILSPPRRTCNCLTSRELLHIAENVADKVEYLAAVLGDREVQRLRMTNEKNVVLKTYHLLLGWEENQHDGVNTRHELARALQEIGKTKMADRLRHGTVHQVHHTSNTQFPYQDAILFTGARSVKEEQIPLLASALAVGDAELTSLRSDYQARPEGLVNTLFQRWWAKEKRDFKEFLALLRTAGCLGAAKRMEEEYCSLNRL